MWPSWIFAAAAMLILADFGLAIPAPNKPKKGHCTVDDVKMESVDVLGGRSCMKTTYYCVTGYSKHWTKPKLETGSTVKGDGSISIGRISSVSKTLTFDAGFGLNLTKLGKFFQGLDIGASYAISVTESSTESVTVNCPDGVECGVLTSKGYIKVTGKYHTLMQGTCVDKSKVEDFKAAFPWKINDKKDKGGLKIKTEACAVGRKDVKGMKKCPGTKPKDKSDSKRKYEPFPGKKFFKRTPKSPIIEAMGKRLVAEGCSAYSKGPGQQWTEADRKSYQLWQQSLGYTGGEADGWPGKKSWKKLKVPKS